MIARRIGWMARTVLVGALACGAPLKSTAPAAAVPSPGGALRERASGQAEILIWPGIPPNSSTAAVSQKETTRVVTDRLVAGRPWTEVGGVTRPTMTVYSPQGKNSGAAVVVFPGGGYWVLAMDLEGTEVCDWLTSRGVTCVLLKYRVPGAGKGVEPDETWPPRSGPYPDSPIALEDAQRALGLVRARAAEWKIDPHKIGVLGFSAGGHLVAAASTHFERIYPRVDSADDESCRPDFAIAVYPGHLVSGVNDLTLAAAVPVSKKTPPTFLVQAEDDPVDAIENSIVYFEALRHAGVPAELHIFPRGGHAFGLRAQSETPITKWPRLAEVWMRGLGVIAD